MENKIRLKFNKHMPKDAARFFKPDSDDSFKTEHPVGYGVLIVCGVIALFLPMCVLQ